MLHDFLRLCYDELLNYKCKKMQSKYEKVYHVSATNTSVMEVEPTDMGGVRLTPTPSS